MGWFSDTILIYGLDGTSEASRKVLETVGWLLLYSLLGTRLRIRAGVDFGELHVDQASEIFVGKALVGAHDLEEAQDWA
ncbi:MAG: hypothetical protein RDV41_06465, partial [Planctomycetota bacterium]|nr:hypothetical protein [Planctomycetota bacterium]